MSEEYDGRKVVGLDLHRNRTVMVRMTAGGEQVEAVRFLNGVEQLTAQIAKAGVAPEVVVEATHGWYWAVDALQAAGASVHLAHPLGVKGFAYRRVKNDLRDAAYLADLLGMGRLPEAWIAPPRVRERPSPTSWAAAMHDRWWTAVVPPVGWRVVKCTVANDLAHCAAPARIWS